MLVQKGLLSHPVGLWNSVVELFQNTVFVDGKAPTSHFVEAFEGLVGEQRSRSDLFRSRAPKRRYVRNATDLHDLLDPTGNRFYKERTLLQVFNRANWALARIPDEELPLSTGLAFIRLAEVKRRRDRVTGKVTLDDTDLVKRARSRGWSDEDIIAASSKLPSQSKDPHTAEVMKALRSTASEVYTVRNWSNAHAEGEFDLIRHLSVLRLDFISDICGEMRPLSSLNYIAVLASCYLLFMGIEDSLKKCRNPIWVQIYEGNSELTEQKRVSLTVFALAEADPECLRIMADVFEKMRCGFIHHIYWDDLMDTKEATETFKSGDKVPFGPNSCMIM
ncbi:hypothetical protein N7537_011774 [Penicillium hordei]|uniref:Uncharacterized protein n=1 Tax=Penicillium hordei TaxID=40994 RepID=A0AAD6GS26_9EURO|nr:uncharacterized protein N7537_011774 [Penicillium hordei]KAJ5589096.1 hypothetical protein N7537_011774 [Penicillium hordei]